MCRLMGYCQEQLSNSPAGAAEGVGVGRTEDCYVLEAVYKDGDERYVVKFGSVMGKRETDRILEELAKAHRVPVFNLLLDRTTLFGRGKKEWCQLKRNCWLESQFAAEHAADAEILGAIPGEQRFLSSYRVDQLIEQYDYDDSRSMRKQVFDLDNGRQVSAELWSECGITYLTYTLSSQGIKGYDKGQLIDYMNQHGTNIDKADWEPKSELLHLELSSEFRLTVKIGESDE